MRRKWTLPLIPVIVAGFCLGAFILETQAKILRRTIDELVYDNWNHYLPCGKLPAELEVRKVVEERSGTIRQIEQVNPGHVGVEIHPSGCPGKADLVIWYASHQNRQAIEEIIAGETFYGVPYRLQNR